jgi:hypothetical protein
MYILSFFLVLLSFAPQSTAASDLASGEPRGLVVKDFYWGRVVSRTFVDSPYSTSSDPWDMPRIRRRPGGAPPTVLLQRETYLLVRNVGTRAVKFVTWDYVFYADAKHARETKRYRFRSKETVGPGEMKFITEGVGEPSPTAYGAVEIERIEFEDGTTWQRSAG